ncbi:kinase-like domain-containing protein [Rhizophagus irregularis DAOM 181602=DAOM 197198]|nr:kinase-like domain-containing protein [Rhizophagus irregularis DAOM 181602=DAOM 197198]
MMVSDDFKDLKDQCEKCGKNYYIWCDSCQINELKNNFGNWTSGDEKIDNFIQEMQLKIYYDNDIIVEWIPYNQFDNIKKINKDGFATVYSAIWKDGPLDDDQKKKKRINNKKVTLKCLYNSKYTIDEFLNEAKTYSINEYDHNILKIYGISQNPNTKDYIMVLQDGYCEKCATWNDGPLYFNKHDNMYKRNQNMKVILKSCYNSQNITDEFLDEVRSYSIYEKDVDTIKIFGISQNPDTKDYIIVLKDGYCEKCAVGWIPYNKQPFVNCVHDQYLTLNICNGVS